MGYHKLILATLFIISFAEAIYAQKTLQYENVTYEKSIKTVQLNRVGNSVEATLAPPVTTVGQQGLVLSFDDLREDADYYYVYFIHCNADWTPSRLRPNMYLNAYNEFEIVNFEFSAEAKTMYVNYNFQLPAFKSSGNYLAVVYRDKDKKDIILSQRFYVVQEKVNAGLRVLRSSEAGNRMTHQRVEVTVNYSEVKAVDPKSQFTVNVRQNQRSDMTTYQLPSTYIDENSQLIRYQNLGEQNEFAGTNEFRSFDLGTVTFSGRNIQDVRMSNDQVEAQLRTDRPLTESYLQSLDINGQFYIRDLEGRAGSNTAEYVNVQFSLDHAKINEDIYIVGAFNEWQKNEENRMRFNAVNERYEGSIFVKQGWYNYRYELSGQNAHAIDGSFFDTENFYEAFIYFRPLGARGDELIGYVVNNYNTRR